MSTSTQPETTRLEPPTERTRETDAAPLTFATDNEVPIRGLFDSETDQH
ncbi:hypothetical protein [Halorientalis halophila]